MPNKILYASDLHGNKDFYNKLIKKAREEEIKAILIGGDSAPKKPRNSGAGCQLPKRVF